MKEGLSTAPGLRAFGLSLSVDGPVPPGEWEMQPPREPTLQLRVATPETVASSWSGLAATGWEGMIDGAPFIVERGLEGDHRFVHGVLPDENRTFSDGTRAVHYLNAEASALTCAPADPSKPSWWRVVLDSVLFTVALLHGYEALHAGAVATTDGVIAITAASGGGKSTLLIELLGRGVPLMADDVLMLQSRGAEAPLAHPAAPLMTVPTARVPMLSAGGLPETIASLDGELWIGVPVHPEPQQLRALVVLDRRAGLPTRLERIEDPLAPLMGSLLSFPRSIERQQTRFELASVLSSTISLWRLTADLETPPDVIADTLLAGDL